MSESGTQKTILITGATDGIGLAAAQRLAGDGHRLLLHGRSAEKLDGLSKTFPGAETYRADLSAMKEVRQFADDVLGAHDRLDVLINNAGVLKTADTVTKDGLDIRFAVNTLAPYLLTKLLLPLFGKSGRIVNIASAAQAPVDPDALSGKKRNLGDMQAYSQSKLAIIMWTAALAGSIEPMAVSVNPGSLLASKMVKEGFGIEGKDIGIGADILARGATAEEFATARGLYFDNDSGDFAPPHGDALDAAKCERLVADMEAVLARLE